MEGLDGLPARVEKLEVQVSQLRTEMRDEFSATRRELREGDEETRRHMRILHEEVISRIKILGEAWSAGAITSRRSRKKR